MCAVESNISKLDKIQKFDTSLLQGSNNSYTPSWRLVSYHRLRRSQSPPKAQILIVISIRRTFPHLKNFSFWRDGHGRTDTTPRIQLCLLGLPIVFAIAPAIPDIIVGGVIGALSLPECIERLPIHYQLGSVAAPNIGDGPLGRPVVSAVRGVDDADARVPAALVVAFSFPGGPDTALVICQR